MLLYLLFYYTMYTYRRLIIVFSESSSEHIAKGPQTQNFNKYIFKTNIWLFFHLQYGYKNLQIIILVYS